ncbi:MAG: hypothetical protein WBA92_14450, partial [Pseudorhodobacter sp.]
MNSLKLVMRLNAASCVSFGLLFLLMSSEVAAFLGQVPPALIIILGIGLLGNGAHLFGAARRTDIRENEVIWFSLGDFIWWLATLALIVTNLWITTLWGMVTAAGVATIVAGLGVAQLWLLGRHRYGNSNRQHIWVIAESWMALPLWVKIWLAVMNGVFLAAFAFLPDRIAGISLAAYVATVPLLAGQVGYDGGLRRILSLAHLVPWTPLLAWLMIAPDGTIYSTLLTFTVAICLAFDINDLWLFIKGDRAVLG